MTVAATFLVALAAPAQAEVRRAFLDSFQENPDNSTTGRGDFTLQFSANATTLDFVLNYQAVVVDGADAREVEALKNELGVDFIAIPDPAGRISGRLGVGTWPTTVTLDHMGTVSAIDVGGSTGASSEPKAE